MVLFHIVQSFSMVKREDVSQGLRKSSSPRRIEAQQKSNEQSLPTLPLLGLSQNRPLAPQNKVS